MNKSSRKKGDDLDAVLASLDELAASLADLAEAKREISRVTHRVKSLRKKGRTYADIVASGEGPSVKVVQPRLDAVIESMGTLRRAEAKALYGQGMKTREIANAFSVSRQRVAVILGPVSKQRRRRTTR